MVHSEHVYVKIMPVGQDIMVHRKYVYVKIMPS